MKELITEAVKELDENKVYKLIENALEVGMADTEILDCMRLGMDEVGKLFANGDYYVADLIMAGYIFKTFLEMIGIYKKQVSDNQAKDRIIICTPFGDFHDIGKDIKVILGGAVADQDLSHVCDIDYCTNDIAEGMMICSDWMEEKNGTK